MPLNFILSNNFIIIAVKSYKGNVFNLNFRHKSLYFQFVNLVLAIEVKSLGSDIVETTLWTVFPFASVDLVVF